MFKIEDGKIVITSEAAHISEVYTPEEWNAEMLRLLDERQVAINNKAIVKAEYEQVAFPKKPELPTIWGYMLWNAETDKAIAIADLRTEKLKKLNAEIKALESEIIRLMPENFKMYIVDDEKPGAYLVWWTRNYDSEGAQQNTLRIETQKHSPRIVPMSKQIDGDDLESDLEKALWDIETDEDGLEVEYEDEDTVEEYGDDDIPF